MEPPRRCIVASSLDALAIEQNTREAKRPIFRPGEVILFGSIARSEATDLSDVDLLITTRVPLAHGNGIRSPT